ncbi:MAG: hypothetical protein Q7S84_01180 [bacterium]|nr:hypothetical protein [bacterium]
MEITAVDVAFMVGETPLVATLLVATESTNLCVSEFNPLAVLNATRSTLGVDVESATGTFNASVVVNGPAPVHEGVVDASKNPLEALYKEIPEFVLVPSAARSLVKNPVLVASATEIVIAASDSPALPVKEICMAEVVALPPITHTGPPSKFVAFPETAARTVTRYAEAKETTATTDTTRNAILYNFFIPLEINKHNPIDQKGPRIQMLCCS